MVSKKNTGDWFNYKDAIQDLELKEFTLTNIVSLNDELGHGAFGSVFKVKHGGDVYAAKKIHPILIESVRREEKQKVQDDFIGECVRCCRIRHPHIVRSIGVYYQSDQPSIPIMVMELMDTSLTKFIENNKSFIAFDRKISILYDAVQGLNFLHSHVPQILHRDLSPNNILLTSELVAKIGDLGVAKVIQAGNKETISKLRISRAVPGTPDFMPPEAMEINSDYGTSIDVFSFGGIALFVFSEEWPTPSPLRQRDPDTRLMVVLSEVERRKKYLDKMTGKSAGLREIIEQCLDVDPEGRPSVQRISSTIGLLKASKSSSDFCDTFPFPGTVNLQRMNTFPPDEGTKSTNCPPADRGTRNVTEFPVHIPPPPKTTRKTRVSSSVSESSSTDPSAVPVRYPLIQFGSQKEIGQSTANGSGMWQLTNQVESTKINVAKPIEKSISFAKALQSNQYHIKWISGCNLPSKLYNASVATSTDGNDVYVTAGGAPDDQTYNNVYHYNTKTDHWAMLPPSGHRFGVLHMLDDKLTIFGGSDLTTHKPHSKVTAYSSKINRWYNNFPDMLNIRFMPGVMTSKDYVIVMGGRRDRDNIHESIEVMNYRIHPKQWKQISVCLPVPMWCIKLTISGDRAVIVGYGTAFTSQINKHYQIPLQELLSSCDQKFFGHAVSTQWKEFPAATYFDTATIPYSNPPTIIGGKDLNGIATCDVTLYDDVKKSWRKVDSLTHARGNVGVALLNNSTVMIIGGTSGGIGVQQTKVSVTTVEIGKVEFNQQ